MIDEFTGEYAFLSNFSESPIKYLGKTWATVEHLYQASKTTDATLQEKIRLTATPNEAKKIGKQILLSPNWIDNKKHIMFKCVLLKFQQNKNLLERLLLTNDSYLLENNLWHDNIWGNCLCDPCKTIEGENVLGQILMQVRRNLATDPNFLTLLMPSPSSRFFTQVSQFLQSKGINLKLQGKKLTHTAPHLNIIFARGFDIPNAIAAGWGDIGITGLDAVYEAGADITILSNLGIRFSEVVLASTTLKTLNELRPYDTVITEYAKIPKEFFIKHNINNINMVHVTGAAEAYGSLPHVAAIVTLKTSGQSLIDNSLRVLNSIFKTQACLVANPISLQRKSQIIINFMRMLDINAEIKPLQYAC